MPDRIGTVFIDDVYYTPLQIGFSSVDRFSGISAVLNVVVPTRLAHCKIGIPTSSKNWG